MKMLLAMSGLLVTLGGAAAAQPNCAARDLVIERLAERYGESRQSIGIAQQGHVIEVFASRETGTWTITVTSPNGQTCLVASGQAFENLSEELKPAGIRS